MSEKYGDGRPTRSWGSWVRGGAEEIFHVTVQDLEIAGIVDCKPSIILTAPNVYHGKHRGLLVVI
jgi:hypothetical protein